MFEIKYVELMNWAYWPTVKLPMDEGTIMITGPNGSGKTTFLDALRVLLRAPRLSSGRRFQDYLVNDIDTAVVKAVVSNDFEQRERRPFEFKGFQDDSVTLACLMFKRSGRWERKFMILEGDVPLENLRKTPKSHMMTPESYTYEIGQAGFGAAFLKVLALEQGKTDKLCEKSPRALLDLLLEVHGDKKIIDRYKQARENYHAANMDLSQLGARLTEEQAKVMASERAAKEYQRYIQLTNEQGLFETVLLPQAEYVEAKERITELKLEIEEHNSSLGPIDREILRIQEQLDNADSELDRRRREVETAREQKVEFDKRERSLDIKLSQFVAERRQLDQVLEAAKSVDDDIDLDGLFEKRSKLRREIVKLELQEEEIQRRLDSMQQDVLSLDVQRRKVYPRYVEDFTRALGHAGIRFDLLCDVIDIKERDWQLAIESILGRDRFTVIVDEKDQLQARKLGQQNRYRCYVVANDPKAQLDLGGAMKNSAAEMVDLLTEGIRAELAEGRSPERDERPEE
jgi:chromosome segregation ATPase